MNSAARPSNSFIAGLARPQAAGWKRRPRDSPTPPTLRARWRHRRMGPAGFPALKAPRNALGVAPALDYLFQGTAGGERRRRSRHNVEDVDASDERRFQHHHAARRYQIEARAASAQVQLLRAKIAAEQ